MEPIIVNGMRRRHWIRRHTLMLHMFFIDRERVRSWAYNPSGVEKVMPGFAGAIPARDRHEVADSVTANRSC